MGAPNPIKGFRVDPADIVYVGENLNRPECILAQANGTLWTSDGRGGVCRINPDGTQELIGVQSQADGDAVPDKESLSSGSLPNGIALAPDGSVMVANLGLWRLEQIDLTGTSHTLIDSHEGQPLGQVNFVLRDSRDRYWVSVSTRAKDWMVAMRPDVADGYIALYDKGEFRVVAEGFHYTNEIRLDADEEWLYISETCGPHVTRMRVGADGSLSDREIFGPEDHGGLLDGLTFDSYGNLWGTHVFSDRVYVIAPDGEMEIVLDDGDQAKSTALMRNFWAKTLTAEQIMETRGGITGWMTGITFGGEDLKTVHIASVLGPRIPTFRSPIAGLALPHWHETGWR
jgi:gluconolactonase